MVPFKSGVSYGNFGRLESFWRVFLSFKTVSYHDGSTGRKIEDMHGVTVLYTEILRRPSLIMMVMYLGKKKDVKNAEYLIQIGLTVIQEF